jgi:antitoxin (DNA-binding transcriptional repressor) of toxin-antitoxin stability system
MKFFSLRAKLLSLAVAGAVFSVSAPASAQGLFFDWGGNETSGGSGKQVIAFRGGTPGEVIVSFGDRRLYYVTRPGEAISYPIAIPREQSRWQGVTSVTQKRENPSWTPTPTMRAENPRLPMWVPGGHPLNPLGVRALYLGSSMYRIHGTDAPWTIGSAASKGCVRMFNQDVLDLYPRVKTGAKVTVTWNTYTGTPVANAAPSQASDDPAAKKQRYYRPIAATTRRAPKPTQTQGEE